MKTCRILDEKGKETVASAIKEAEKNTSGEIRVHIDNSCKTDIYKRAVEVFHYLKMDNTEARNGVLIYVAFEQKKFAIIGDKGINDAVPEGFWNDVIDEMKPCFSKGEFAEGLVRGISMAGDRLGKYFPYKESDANELPDDVSFEY